jgi:hypothetical protein
VLAFPLPLAGAERSEAGASGLHRRFPASAHEIRVTASTGWIVLQNGLG